MFIDLTYNIKSQLKLRFYKYSILHTFKIDMSFEQVGWLNSIDNTYILSSAFQTSSCFYLYQNYSINWNVHQWDRRLLETVWDEGNVIFSAGFGIIPCFAC